MGLFDDVLKPEVRKTPTQPRGGGLFIDVLEPEVQVTQPPQPTRLFQDVLQPQPSLFDDVIEAGKQTGRFATGLFKGLFWEWPKDIIEDVTTIGVSQPIFTITNLLKPETFKGLSPIEQLRQKKMGEGAALAISLRGEKPRDELSSTQKVQWWSNKINNTIREQEGALTAYAIGSIVLDLLPLAGLISVKPKPKIPKPKKPIAPPPTAADIAAAKARGAGRAFPRFKTGLPSFRKPTLPPEIFGPIEQAQIIRPAPKIIRPAPKLGVSQLSRLIDDALRQGKALTEVQTIINTAVGKIQPVISNVVRIKVPIAPFVGIAARPPEIPVTAQALQATKQIDNIIAEAKKGIKALPQEIINKQKEISQVEREVQVIERRGLRVVLQRGKVTPETAEILRARGVTVKPSQIISIKKPIIKPKVTKLEVKKAIRSIIGRAVEPTKIGIRKAGIRIPEITAQRVRQEMLSKKQVTLAQLRSKEFQSQINTQIKALRLRRKIVGLKQFKKEVLEPITAEKASNELIAKVNIRIKQLSQGFINKEGRRVKPVVGNGQLRKLKKAFLPLGRLSLATQKEASIFLDAINEIPKQVAATGLRFKVPTTRALVEPEKIARVREIETPGFLRFTEPFFALQMMGLREIIGVPLEEGVKQWQEKLKEIDLLLTRWANLAGIKKRGDEAAEQMFEIADTTPGGLFLTNIRPNKGQLQVKKEWSELARDLKVRLGIESSLDDTYITHLIDETGKLILDTIDKQMSSKNASDFPEEFAKVIDFVFPKEIFNRFNLPRKGFPFIKKDFIEATRAYLITVHKKLIFDPIIKQIRPWVLQLRPEVQAHVKDIINFSILEKPKKDISVGVIKQLDKVLKDRMTKVFGTKMIALDEEQAKVIKAINEELPTEFEVPRMSVTINSIQRFIAKVKLINYLALIAGSVKTLLVNLTQPLILGVAKLQSPVPTRLKIVLTAYATMIPKIFNREVWRELGALEVLQETQKLLELGTKQQKIVEKGMDFAFANMKWSEFVNRLVTSRMGALDKREAFKRGWITQEELNKLVDFRFKRQLIKLDKEFSDLINYRYGKAYTAPIWLSPIGRMSYHLNSFGLKYAQEVFRFIQEVKLGKIIRQYSKLLAKQALTESKITSEEKLKLEQLKNQREQMQFILQLKPQQRGNFIIWLMMGVLLGSLFGDVLRLTTKSVGFGINPIITVLSKILSGEIPAAGTEIIKQGLPFRRALDNLEDIFK